MSNRGLAAGLFRAWGLMWLVYVLIGVPQFVNNILHKGYGAEQEAMQKFSVASYAISFGCELVIAIFLIRKAGWLSEIVFPVEQTAGFTFGAQDLQAVLFSAIGLYFVLDGTRHLAGSAFVLMTRLWGNDQGALSYLWERQPEQLAVGLGGALAGAFVLLGSGRRLNPLKRIRGVYQRLFGLKASPGE
jgi:hypothetical protein